MTNKIDKIQMPDGQVLELGYSELNNPYSLFDSKYSDHELNNLSWLKSEGQWNAKAFYPTAYDKLLKVYNGTETVEGLSVKLSTEEYTDYDFVLNTADETFRLPLLNGSEDIPSDRYDDLELKESGTPYTAPANGLYQCACTGEAGSTYFELVTDKVSSTASFVGGWARASIPVKRGDVVTVYYGGTNFTKQVFRFTYAQGNGSLYYYVGETVQNANLIDAGRIGEQLATKTDMLQASGASMPSDRYIDLTLGASGTEYTAPANGWFLCEKVSNGNSQNIIFITNYGRIIGWNGSNNPTSAAIMAPVKKGDVITVTYNLGGATKYFRFIYAEGSK